VPSSTPSPEDSLRSGRRAALAYSLSQAPIFAGLPEAELQRLADYCRLEQVARGRHLFRQGDPVRGFFVVRVGSIHVYRRSEEGREQAIHLLRPGDSFAERAMISEAGYPAHARALEESEVILIPVEEFRLHQGERPDLAWRMLSSMSHHLRSLVAQLEGLRFGDVERRLIHWLLQRASTPEAMEAAESVETDGGAEPADDETPVEFDLGLTQTALARELATRRETLSRTLHKLQKEGAITLTKGPKTRVTIPAPSRLAARLRTSQPQ